MRRLNPRNARTHSKRQIHQIASSIREFGFQNPILVDEAAGIIAGHGRLAAAKELGPAEVPVIEVHGLSEAKKRALALADNKISDNAGVHDQDTRDLVARHVERVVPEATVVEIRLRARDVDSSRSRSDGEELVVRVQLERRPRDRKEIIVFANGGMPAQSLDHSLVLTVARGRTCVKALREGEFAGTAEIASKWGLSEPYLKRMLRLAFLAPDIVEAIAEGRHPGGLTLERLLSPVPLAWPEQRWDFGFAP